MAPNRVITGRAQDGSYLSWSAIIAGALVATAYSFVMLTFGAAVGLSFVTPFQQDGNAQTILLIAVALWIIWVQVSGFALGGYVAGRARAPVPGATQHEAEIRDGVQGSMVWATGTLLGVLLAVWVTGSVVGVTGQTATTLMSGASGPSSTVTTQALADSLLRNNVSGDQQRANSATREEVGRIVTPAATGGEVNADDRTYLANLIAAETNLSPAEAETRVDQVLFQARQTAQDAQNAAIIIGFIMTASFLISLAAAWWAADLGGYHRDIGADLSRYTRWRPRAEGAAMSANDDGRDDLTNIKGIGPSLKAQLYDMNITTFRQIANFDQSDIDRINDELSFPGRIERENWVDQARELDQQKHYA